MTDQKQFDAELEEAAQEFARRREKRGRMPGCVVAFFICFLLALFLFLPHFLCGEAREVWDFYGCGQATMGRVLDCKRIRPGSRRRGYHHMVTIAYTPAGGTEQRLEQKTGQEWLYPVGAPVKVRYQEDREGVAFIDNGHEDKTRMLAFVLGGGFIWCVIAFMVVYLGQGLLDGLRARLRRRQGK